MSLLIRFPVIDRNFAVHVLIDLYLCDGHEKDHNHYSLKAYAKKREDGSCEYWQAENESACSNQTANATPDG